MTERKPVEDTFESWVDKQIREATERGEFDGLRGTGKPIPGAGSSVDEHWWILDYLRREGVPTDGLLPDSLMLRRELERLGAQVADCGSEAEVRAEVAALNRRIVAWIRTPTPPLVPLAPADAEEMVARWRAARRARPSSAARGNPRPPSSGGTSSAADGPVRGDARSEAGDRGGMRTGAEAEIAADTPDRADTGGEHSARGGRGWQAILRAFRRR